MGVNTKGYLKNEITASEVLNVIITKYDENATMDMETKEYREDFKVECGSIFFKDGEDDRRIWFYKDLMGKEKTSLSLNYWGNSVEIMSNILKSFGGELVENDCSELDMIEIPKDENYSHSDRAKLLDSIIAKLDEKLGITQRTNIANQIIKHREVLKELL